MTEKFNGAFSQYLQPTAVFDSDHEDVVRFAKESVKGADDPVEQARRLFHAVREGIIYDLRTPFHLPEHYRASNVLKNGRGYCVPKASLLCSAARACGIPARLGFADIRNYGVSKDIVEMMGSNLFVYHGFVELFLKGRWVKATPAFDTTVYKKHNIPPITFDGEHDTLLPSHDLNGNPYVEYVVDHGSFADLPLDEILAAWREAYGSDRVQAWINTFVIR